MSTHFMKLIVDMLRAGADAADTIDPCKKCKAPPGRPCVTVAQGNPQPHRHHDRLSGDITLSFTLRTMADNLEDGIEKLEAEGWSVDI